MAKTPKAIWFGTTKKAEHGGTVRLKHRELFLGSSVKNAAVDVVEQSRDAVKTVVSHLDGELLEITKQSLKRCFKTADLGPTQDQLNTIKSKLVLIQNGICGDVNLKTQNTSAKRTGVIFKGVMQQHGFTPTQLQSALEGYITSYVNRKGDIHVKRDFILNNKYQAIRTFIHEASHRFADTVDESYLWQDDWNGKDTNALLNNADSYAYLVMFIFFGPEP